MTYKLSEIVAPSFKDSHRKVNSGEITELVEKGGRGGAKSSFMSVELVLQLIKHPQCHAVVFRKVSNTLRTSVYAQICWAINALGLYKHFKFTVSPMECVYVPTGQKIMFFGCDDPSKIKSIKAPFGYIGIAWFEELDAFHGEEEIRNIEQSVFRGGDFSLSLKSFNPPSALRNWANQYALQPKEGKLVHHSTYLEVPQNWLGQRFIDDAEHLKNTNENAYRHEYLGEVIGSGRAVFENLKIEPIPQEEINNFDRIFYGVDWGWYPDPWQFVACYYHNKKLWIFDELRRWRTSNEDTAKLLIAKGVMQTPHTQDKLIADSAEPKSCADYTRMGVKCLPVIKGAGSVERRMKWIQGLDAIIIDPVRCPNVAKEFGEYEYDSNPRTGEVMEGYPDRDNHSIDAVTYSCMDIWIKPIRKL